MSFSDRVLDGLGPAFRERAGDQLDNLVRGLTRELQRVDDLTTPTERGWATVFDLELTPLPGYLAQIAGTRLPAALTTEQQRAHVRDRSAWRRAALEAMAAAIDAALPDGARFEILERVDSPWRLAIRIFDPTGTVTDDQVLAAAGQEKAVGLRLVEVHREEPITYAELSALADDYGDLAQLELSTDEVGLPIPRRWWRRGVTRYARMTAEHDTYAAFTAAFPTYAAATNHQEG